MRFFFIILRTVFFAHIVAVFTVGPSMAQTALSPFPMSKKNLEDSQQNSDSIRSLSNTNTDLLNSGVKSYNSSSSLSANTSLGQNYSIIKIHVLGDVENPGIYQVDISERLSNVLALAVPKRPSQRLVQLRNPSGGTRVFDLYKYYYQGDLANNPFLKENDVIFVPPHKGAVRIEGPVARPGLYELSNEKTLDDIVRLAGNMTSAVSSIHSIKVIRFSEEGKKFVINVKDTSHDRRDFKIMKGDIIIIPDIVNNPSKFDYTVESIPGENLFYPTSTPNVFVMGQVSQAGSYPYKSQLRVKDYIAYASPSPQARLNRVTLIRDGKRTPLRFDEKPIPGDILVVKSKISVGVIVTALSTAMTLVLTTLLLKSQLENQ